MESVQEHFVNLTKAYKAFVPSTVSIAADLLLTISSSSSLTDETIRKNVLDFNDPDGRQQFSTGIAIPHWIVESKNSVWVLGFYALIFGGGLPAAYGGIVF